MESHNCVLSLIELEKYLEEGGVQVMSIQPLEVKQLQEGI